MSQKRKLIRQAALAMLVGQTAAGARVFVDNADRVFEEELPCILLNPDGEASIEISSDGPREYKRQLTLHVITAAKGATLASVLDALDDLDHQVEQILFRNDTFNGTAANSRLVRVDQDLAIEGKTIVGSHRITFEVAYYQDAPDPAGDQLDSFESAGVEIDTAPSPDGVPEIEAEVALPQ